MLCSAREPAIPSKLPMNTLIFRSEQLHSDRSVTLDPRQQQHLSRVLNVSAGQSVRIGELNGLLGRAKVGIFKNEIRLEEYVLDTAPAAGLETHLILALPRPQMIKRILQTIATFGVRHCSLIHTQRVEKSFWQSPVLEEASIYENLLLGLEQANATQMPSISMHKRFKPFIEDECSAKTIGREKILLEPGNYPIISRKNDTPTCIAIGPEGGFTSYEVEKWIAAEFSPHQLGERILKVETAVTASLARLI